MAVSLFIVCLFFGRGRGLSGVNHATAIYGDAVGVGMGVDIGTRARLPQHPYWASAPLTCDAAGSPFFYVRTGIFRAGLFFWPLRAG